VIPHNVYQDAQHQNIVAGPITGFVQRGDLMLDRIRTMLVQPNFRGIRREALKIKALIAQLENRRLLLLADSLVMQAEQAQRGEAEASGSAEAGKVCEPGGEKGGKGGEARGAKGGKAAEFRAKAGTVDEPGWATSG
jgi:hypothetical protein